MHLHTRFLLPGCPTGEAGLSTHRVRPRARATALWAPQIACAASAIPATVTETAIAAAEVAATSATVASRLLEVDAGKRLPVWQVGLAKSLQIACFTAACVAVVAVISAAGERATKQLRLHMQSEKEVQLLQAALPALLYSLKRPCEYFLPAITALFALHTVADLMEDVVAGVGQRVFAACGARDLQQQVAAVLNAADQTTSHLAHVLFIALGAWCLIRFKTKLVELTTSHQAPHGGSSTNGGGDGGSSVELLTEVDRLIRPLNQAADWVIVTAAALQGLAVFGVDVGPLLKVGGVSGIALGFGAQNVTASVISGLNLFVTRPFVVGERIVLMTTGGGKVVEGVVESINPMRTVISTGEGHPVALPNKALTEMAIINQSRAKGEERLDRVAPPALMCSTLGVKYKDYMDLTTLASKVEGYLRERDDVSPDLPLGCTLHSLGEGGKAEFRIKAHVNAASMESTRVSIMLAVAKLVDLADGCELTCAQACV